MMDVNAGFAAWLRTARRQAGLSQQQVADALKGSGLTITQSQLAKIERGARGIQLHEAVLLAGLFGWTLDEALGLKSGPDSVAAERAARRTSLLAQIRDLADAELRGGDES